MSRERFKCQQTHLKFNTTYRSLSGFLIDYLPRTFLPASPHSPLPHPRYKIRGKERCPQQTWHRPARAEAPRRDPRREGAGRDVSDPRRCAAALGTARPREERAATRPAPPPRCPCPGPGPRGIGCPDLHRAPPRRAAPQRPQAARPRQRRERRRRQRPAAAQPEPGRCLLRHGRRAASSGRPPRKGTFPSPVATGTSSRQAFACLTHRRQRGYGLQRSSLPWFCSLRSQRE